MVGAALHPLLGACIQEGTRRGVGLTVIVSTANLLTCLVFFTLNPTGGWQISGGDCLLSETEDVFLGQWFSIQSVKSGDLAVHSSALGLKVVMVGVLFLMVGLEEIRGIWSVEFYWRLWRFFWFPVETLGGANIGAQSG